MPTPVTVARDGAIGRGATATARPPRAIAALAELPFTPDREHV